MAMKTVKITKYVTSDGKEFIGSKSKPRASEHERYLKNNLADHNHNLNLAKIMDEEKIYDGWEDEDVLSDNVDIEQEFGDLADTLFADAVCSNELQDFKDMSIMIRDVVDAFGGIKIIEKLHAYATENF